MVSLSKCIFLYSLILLLKPIISRQSYDNSNCTDQALVPGSNYTCIPKTSCQTFVVYRAQTKYQTLSSIASLFNTNTSQLGFSNNISKDDSSIFQPGREIIVPVTCLCPDQFSQSVYTFNASISDSLNKIACDVFEGLVKAQSLIDHNQGFGGNELNAYVVEVPIRCACPDSLDTRMGVKYLVTYPILEMDNIHLIALKFGVSERMILDANRLDVFPAVFAQTTILVPTIGVPVLNLEGVSLPTDPSPGPRSMIPVFQVVPGTKSKNKRFHVYLLVGISGVIVVIGIACGVLIAISKKYGCHRFKTFFVRTSPMPKFSADFLDGVSRLKHSLVNFSLEDLKMATEDFSEASVIGTLVYRGRIGGSHVAIEQMNSEEEAHRVIYILTKINHLNVVKLEGCCYGKLPYLVFEFAENGSLRNCLSNSKLAKQMTWTKRLQIAFDLAAGLDYIHHCTKPTYIHRNINSSNVIITVDWRAKISGFRFAKSLIRNEENEETEWSESEIVGRKGYLAPEYLDYGQASTKVDVYAFGVVLLELLSAKEAIGERFFLKDCLKFLADGGGEDSLTCLETLKGFMDPGLAGDYPLGDAICLAMLAKCCVEDDPLHRPTMNDVLKALSRIL